ncbi:hypothetical protein I8282_004879, partial [Serratia marcescens]
NERLFLRFNRRQTANGQRGRHQHVSVAWVGHGGLVKRESGVIMNILHQAVNLQQIDNIVIHDSVARMSLANK